MVRAHTGLASNAVFAQDERIGRRHHVSLPSAASWSALKVGSA
jgi:hypothetical protein